MRRLCLYKEKKKRDRDALVLLIESEEKMSRQQRIVKKKKKKKGLKCLQLGMWKPGKGEERKRESNNEVCFLPRIVFWKG